MGTSQPLLRVVAVLVVLCFQIRTTTSLLDKKEPVRGLWFTSYNNTALSGVPLENETVDSLTVAALRLGAFQSMTLQGQLYPPLRVSESSVDWVLFGLQGDAGYVRLWVDDHLMLDTNMTLSEGDGDTASYAVPIPFLRKTSSIRLELTTHQKTPSFLRLLANGTDIDTDFFSPIVLPPEQQYQKERMESERGWNTWLSGDMLTHALLPHGIAVSLSLCSGDNTNHSSCVSNLGQNSPSCDSTQFPAKHGLHAFRGEYTEVEYVTVGNDGAKFRIESATAGDSHDILVLVVTMLSSNTTTSLVGAQTSVPPDFEPRFCHSSIEQSQNATSKTGMSLVAACPGLEQVTLQLIDGDHDVVESRARETGMSVAMNARDGTRVAFVASMEQSNLSRIPTTLPECVDIISKARQELLSKFQEFGSDHNETVAGMLTAISWNVIYTPYEGIITPVFRGHGWEVSVPHDYVLFEWDTYLASMIALWTDPWVAKNNIIRMTKSLNYQGFVAGFWNGKCGEMDKTKPPVGGLAIEYLLKHDSSTRPWIPQLLFPRLVLWNRWIASNRQISLLSKSKNKTAGLVAPGSIRANLDLAMNCDSFHQSPGFASNCETGLDNSPLYDHASFVASENVLDVVDVGMTSLYIRDCQALERMARLLGHFDLASEFSTRASLNSRELQTLWNDQLGIYVNKQWTTGAWADDPLELAPTSFYPMLSRTPTDSQVQSMVSRYLVNSSEFSVNNGTNHGIPSISRSSRAYHDNDYWRGRAWGPMTFLVYVGLDRYSQIPLVQEARANLARQAKSTFLVEWIANHRIMENFNSETGVGCDVKSAKPFYHWGALHALVALTESKLLQHVRRVFVGKESTVLLKEKEQ